MVKVNMRTLAYEGDLKPTSEKSLHAAIYHNRPDIGGIIHTHAKYCCVYAAARGDLPIPTGSGRLRFKAQSNSRLTRRPAAKPSQKTPQLPSVTTTVQSWRSWDDRPAAKTSLPPSKTVSSSKPLQRLRCRNNDQQSCRMMVSKSDIGQSGSFVMICILLCTNHLRTFTSVKQTRFSRIQQRAFCCKFFFCLADCCVHSCSFQHFLVSFNTQNH